MTSQRTRLQQRMSAVLALIMIPLLAGCGSGAAADDAPRERLTIVATTGMIGDVVRNIAGDRAEVHVLMGPGVDPHLYRPTRRDVQRLLNADIVFYNGLNLEGRMTETFERIARSGVSVYAVAEMVDQSLLLKPVEFEGQFDPHIWMDVMNWRSAGKAVARALAEVDPSHAREYSVRAGEYLRKFDTLDAWAREAVATIPEEQRILVTAHDAFNYFSRAYGIEVEAIQGISTDSEAGLRRIEELVDLLVTRRIAAVFTETSVSDKNIQALIAGAAARGHRVAIGGELFSDAMGEDGTPEGTYLGMIEHNVRTIVEALGGTVPEGTPVRAAAKVSDEHGD